VSGSGSRRDHKRFCEIEGWTAVTNARGKAVGHHITFELPLADGRILRTRISRPADNSGYGPSLWEAILRDQLDISEKQFWDCVQHKVTPPRPGTSPAIPAAGIPAALVYQLLNTVGLEESEVAAMTKEQAVARMTAHWSAL